MAKTKKIDKRQFILIGYLGICVTMVVLTLFLAFTSEDMNSTQVTDTLTRTTNPQVLTLQAEGYEEEEHGQGQGKGQGNRIRTTETAEAMPTITPTPEL